MVLTIQHDRDYIGPKVNIFRYTREVVLLCQFMGKYFKEIKLPPARMIRVIVTNDENIRENIKEAFTDSPVCLVTYHYDINRYLEKDDKGKIEEILRILEEAVRRVSIKMGFDPAIFNSGFEAVRALNGHFEYKITKPKSLKRGGFPKAHIVCYMLPSYRRFMLRLEYRDGERKDIEIIRTNNYYINFMEGPEKVITDGEWKDEDTYVVYGKKGDYKRIIYTIDIPGEGVSITFNLEPNVKEDKFMKEFDTATTMDDELVNEYLKDRSAGSWWHVYL